MKALDDYTVEFVFNESYYNSLLMSGAMEIMPKHFYEKYLKQPEKFNESKGILLGSGPYRLKDPENWTPDKNAVELIIPVFTFGTAIPRSGGILMRFRTPVKPDFFHLNTRFT